MKIAELEQRKREDDHNYDFALKSLEAQKEDRSESRKIFCAHKKVVYLYTAVLLIVVLFFFGWAMQNGHGDLIAYMLERAIYFGAGGASLYGYGRYKQKSDKEDE